MPIIAPVAYNEDHSEEQESDLTPLTAQQASALLDRFTPISPWWVLRWQMGAGCLSVFVAWLVGSAAWGWSAGYGALAIVVPSIVFVRGVGRTRSSLHAGSVLAGFFVWEMVKIVLTVAMLVAAPRLLAQVNWLVLLAGFVLTMKASWVALWLRPGRKNLV